MCYNVFISIRNIETFDYKHFKSRIIIIDRQQLDSKLSDVCVV